MWPFKRKPKKVINCLYQPGIFVRFMQRGEMCYGTIWNVKETEEGKILYDIQVGAQCPWFAEDIPEEIIKPHKISY